MNEIYNKKDFYNEILQDNSNFKVWKKLDNGCFIGTLGYSEENIYYLENLLKSFSKEYGEVINYDVAKEELELYSKCGKLFVYLDNKLKPVSMNGIIYNHQAKSIEFFKADDEDVKSIYFYGLSTLEEYRGKGACSKLINFAIEYAYYNNFDVVYARCSLDNSKSEKIMLKNNMIPCCYDKNIICENVDVEGSITSRYHLYLPLKKGIGIMPKDEYQFATYDDKKLLNDFQSKKYIKKSNN